MSAKRDGLFDTDRIDLYRCVSTRGFEWRQREHMRNQTGGVPAGAVLMTDVLKVLKDTY
jgi:hypothetical protein